MTNEYFPHLPGGSAAFTGQTLKELGYNITLKGAVTLDPREIIKEWSAAALNELTEKELYAGLKIYCPDTQEYKVCAWTPYTNPSASRHFTGMDCVWENIPIGQYEENEWRNVTAASSFARETLAQKIARYEEGSWKYGISANNTYWGFFDLKLDPSVTIGVTDFNTYWNDAMTNRFLNQVITKECMINVSGAPILNVSGSVSNIQSMPGSVTNILYDKGSGEFDNMVGCYLVIFTPSIYRTSVSERRYLDVMYRDTTSVEHSYDTMTNRPKRGKVTLTYKNNDGLDETNIWDVYIVNRPASVSAGVLQPQTSNGIQIKYQSA